MKKNYAVIDIGTLKVKFLIASPVPSGELKEVYFSNTLTCFGVGIEKNNGIISGKYLEDTIVELKRCRGLIKEYGVAKTRVVSTHVLRRAKNKEEIIARIRKEVGFGVENISQEDEAKLFFKAVMTGFDSKKEYAVVDMGGGSVQILVGHKGELKATHLIQTGAQYLHDNFTFNPHLPESFTREEDIEKMRRYILEQLTPLAGIAKIPLVYGSSNIIDLMKTIGIPLKSFSDSRTHPYKTYARYLEEFIKRVLPLNYAQREAQFSFQKGYMWGIDKGFLNIVTIAHYLRSPYIIPSNANIAQGVICSLLEE